MIEKVRTHGLAWTQPRLMSMTRHVMSYVRGNRTWDATFARDFSSPPHERKGGFRSRRNRAKSEEIARSKVKQKIANEIKVKVRKIENKIKERKRKETIEQTERKHSPPAHDTAAPMRVPGYAAVGRVRAEADPAVAQRTEDAVGFEGGDVRVRRQVGAPLRLGALRSAGPFRRWAGGVVGH